MSISQPQLKVVLVTMTHEDWKDFTGVTCGIEFENGEARLAMDMDKHGRDMLALNNVCLTYIGTSYVVEGDYEEEADSDGKTPDEDSGKEASTPLAAIDPPEGSEASESESDEDSGEVDEDEG